LLEVLQKRKKLKHGIKSIIDDYVCLVFASRRDRKELLEAMERYNLSPYATLILERLEEKLAPIMNKREFALRLSTLDSKRSKRSMQERAAILVNLENLITQRENFYRKGFEDPL
ncbi:MAG: hypothetical protein KBS81_10015, partial [Spirochaetales bacterium]|nr:hypothetical protein [Candidatus Physcosoma equi]